MPRYASIRILCTIFVILCLLSVASCSNNDSNTNSSASSTAQPKATEAAVLTTPTRPIEQPKATEAAVLATSTPLEITATAAPVAEHDLQGKEIKLLAKGFGQNETSAGIGIVLENPNTKLVAMETPLIIIAYDDTDTVLDSTNGMVYAIFPGEKLGIAGTLVPPRGSKIHKLDVFVGTPKRFITAAKLKGSIFSVEGVSYDDNILFPTVKGTVKTVINKSVTSASVQVLAYDEKGNIIGGGRNRIEYVPSKERIQVDSEITTSQKPAKVELYVTISGDSHFPFDAIDQ